MVEKIDKIPKSWYLGFIFTDNVWLCLISDLFILFIFSTKLLVILVII